jgi:hypothetical protein
MSEMRLKDLTIGGVLDQAREISQVGPKESATAEEMTTRQNGEKTAKDAIN